MITLVHAFSELMNLYGEYANVDVLARTLAEAGEEVRVVRLPRLEGFSPEACDFLFVGAGTEGAAAAACAEAAAQKDALAQAVRRGSFALLCGNAPAVFGTGLERDGVLREGAGLLDIKYTVMPGKRYYTELLADCTEVAQPVVGCLNTSCRVTSGEPPWFSVRFDAAGLLTEPTEGARRGNLFATSLTGPLLVRNPALRDWFAGQLAGRTIADRQARWQQVMQSGYDSVVQTLTKETERAG